MKLAVLLSAVLTASLGACGGSGAEPVEVAKPVQGFDITGNTARLADQLAQAGIAVHSVRCFARLPLQLPLPGGELPIDFSLLYTFSIAAADLDKARNLGFAERASVAGYGTETVPCVSGTPIQPD
jgi:hypothetical protein